MENYQETKLKTIAKNYILSKTPYFSHYHPQPLFIHIFISRVEKAYSFLADPLKVIINNDFFYQDYPWWWKVQYSEKTYLLLKQIAIYQFMEAYEELN